MNRQNFVLEHRGQFVSRYQFDCVLLGELSSARLFHNLHAAKKTVNDIAPSLGTHPSEFRIRRVLCDNSTPFTKITTAPGPREDERARFPNGELIINDRTHEGKEEDSSYR